MPREHSCGWAKGAVPRGRKWKEKNSQLSTNTSQYSDMSGGAMTEGCYLSGWIYVVEKARDPYCFFTALIQPD